MFFLKALHGILAGLLFGMRPWGWVPPKSWTYARGKVARKICRLFSNIYSQSLRSIASGTGLRKEHTHAGLPKDRIAWAHPSGFVEVGRMHDSMLLNQTIVGRQRKFAGEARWGRWGPPKLSLT